MQSRQGAPIVRRGEDGQAMRLEAPELVVLDEIVQLLDQVVDAPLVRSCRLQLTQRILGQILEQDAIRVRFGADRRGGRMMDIAMSWRRVARSASSSVVGRSI
ncbi:MAG: hypothetical protein EOM22_06815 [Gammaproteobacteria bacterium]|nr:hypothetical protein [Gammaproteobacteria bacterium]